MDIFDSYDRNSLNRYLLLISNYIFSHLSTYITGFHGAKLEKFRCDCLVTLFGLDLEVFSVIILNTNDFTTWICNGVFFKKVKFH